MTRGELRAAMKRQRLELRERLRALQASSEAQLAKDPRVQQARRRRRARRLAALALLLLLLLLIRCEGSPAPPVALIVGVDAGAPAAPPVDKRPPAKRLTPKVVLSSRPVARPTFEPPARTPPGWVDDFRLQVAARSPRLAECFIGSSRPGALRWTTLLSLKTGAVGEHDFESMGLSADLTRSQLECLEQVLSKPGYRLQPPAEEGLPERVSLVLEF